MNFILPVILLSRVELTPAESDILRSQKSTPMAYHIRYQNRARVPPGLGQFPHSVSLFNYLYVMFGSGALIKPAQGVILASAHKLKTQTAEEKIGAHKAMAGVDSTAKYVRNEKFTQERVIVTWRVHPKFISFVYDVAVAFLRRPFYDTPYVKPIELIPPARARQLAYSRPNANCNKTAWRIDYGAKNAHIFDWNLTVVPVHIYDTAHTAQLESDQSTWMNCQVLLKNIGMNLDATACFKPFSNETCSRKKPVEEFNGTLSNPKACFTHDSGAPVTCYDENEIPYLYGIVGYVLGEPCFQITNEHVELLVPTWVIGEFYNIFSISNKRAASLAVLSLTAVVIAASTRTRI